MAVFFPAPVQAAYIDVGASENWRAIDDSLFNTVIYPMWRSGTVLPSQGYPATIGRGNGLTPSLIANRMMWACGSLGELCTVVDGNVISPTRALFALPFALDRKNASGSFEIIADDYVELWINGYFVFNALLDQNLANKPPFPGLQPAPLEVTIDRGAVSVTGNVLNLGPYLNDLIRPGENVLTVLAMDGALANAGGGCNLPGQQLLILDTSEAFCAYDRLNDYLYVRGSIQDRTAVPEPGTLGLVIAGLAGILSIPRWPVARP